MSLFIKDAELPKTCWNCILNSCCEEPDGSGHWRSVWSCDLTGSESPEDGRSSDCPLIEIKTPHGRLIDADAFEDAFIRYYLEQERSNHLVFAAVEIKQHLADMMGDWPTIIEAEGGTDNG